MSQNNKNIKIVGVGVGGSNVVCRMVKDSYLDAEYVVFNDDIDASEIASADLGIEVLALRNVYAPTGSLDLSMEDFNYYYSDKGEREYVINTIFSDGVTHLVLVGSIAGGWSYVASKWIIAIAKEREIPITLVCSLPFFFEGQDRYDRVLERLIELYVDGAYVCTINASDISKIHKDLNLLNCFEYLDVCMAKTVKQVYDIIANNTVDNEEFENKLHQITRFDISTLPQENKRLTEVIRSKSEPIGDIAPIVKGSVPIIGISRHRIGTDGDGVTTLVGFHGCPLSCEYCINKDCFAPSHYFNDYTPESLYNEIKIDDLYFCSTGGGITFGGGEPALQADFILKFKKLCNPAWKIRIETSLNVAKSYIRELSQIVDEWIIDVKADDCATYKSYTGSSNELVKSNLDYLTSKYGLNVSKEKIHIRIPIIPGYVSLNDAEDTREKYIKKGYNNIEIFKYKIDNVRQFFPDINRGKRICSLLKSIRRDIAEHNNIKLEQRECSHKGGCPGTCQACDNELSKLKLQLLYYGINWNDYPNGSINQMIKSFRDSEEGVIKYENNDDNPVMGIFIDDIYTHGRINEDEWENEIKESIFQKIKKFFNLR